VSRPARDYRTFLRTLLAKRQMNQAQLALVLGRSRSWVSQMMSGGRPLKPGVAMLLADRLELEAEDRMLLLALVELVEGDSELARAQAMAVVAASEAKRPEDNLGEEAVIAMSQWYVGAIWELSRCEGFRADPRWIAATMRPRISTQQAAEALATLVRLEMLTPELRHAGDETHFSTRRLVPSGEMSVAARSFHRQAARLTSDAVGEYPGNERMVVGASLALSDEGARMLRARVEELIAQATAVGRSDPSPPIRVYMFTSSLFPVSLYTDTEYDPLEVE